MIKLLKNKEVRKALLWQLLLSAAACAVCFFFDIRAGLTAAGLSLLLMLRTQWRWRCRSDLS